MRRYFVTAILVGACSEPTSMQTARPRNSPVPAPSAPGLPQPGDARRAVLAVTDFRVCLARDARRISCWVSGEDPDRSSGNLVERNHALAADIAVLAGGKSHVCALDATGAVWCWGNNDHGQLGTGGKPHSDEPIRVGLPGPATDLTLGYETSCALVGGKPYCWGELEQGGAPQRTPHQVEIPRLASRLAITMNMLVAISDSAVHFYDTAFLTERAMVEKAEAPAPALGAVREVQLRALSGCALGVDGTVTCWNGMPPSDTSSRIRRPALAGRRVRQLATLQNGACALMVDDVLVCWGGVPGDLDEPHEGIREIPWEAPRVVPLDGEKITAIAATSYGLCAAVASGGVTCWGHDMVRGHAR
ncbi:MAG: hypothetical protein NT062_02955 [Proteobacteria bacterium]|nr:hypothetical protein [Pseudomonadota bacterium]